MLDSSQYISLGVGLGLSAGFSPGPLTTLVITESLTHGVKSGVKVALAPFFTDAPIILFSLLIMAKLAGFQQVLGGVSAVGGCFLLYIGWVNFNLKPVIVQARSGGSNSLLKGAMANFLSPNPYLFWLSVGGPILRVADWVTGTLFMACFYGMLIPIKMGMAVVAGKSRTFLSGSIYIYLMRFLGLVLWCFAFILFMDGARLMGWLS
ncbi:MAG: LysE family transporter [Spirochaetales bacterium]|jgi:threonine/homoserine/homoserine lactone efflux protein|nr:LysE family transporter [Spirochaetales bacterium]